MTLKLDRREFMRLLGVGAMASAGLTVPFLDRALANPNGRPKRLVLFWSPNGTVPKNFFPTASAQDLASSPILQPLLPYQDDLLVTRTVYQGTGDHKTGTPFSTTGYITPTGENLEDPDPKKRAHISIDQEIALALGSTTAKPSLTICGQSKDNRRGFISANADGTRNVPIKEPAQAYEYLFGPYMGGQDPGAEPGPDLDGQAVADVRRAIYDNVLSGLDGLNQKVPALEQAKLKQHRDAIARMRAQVKDPTQNPPEFICDAQNPLAPSVRFDYSERLDKHCELIADAFACDLTRVVSFMTAPSGGDNTNFGFLGVGGDIHQSIAHGCSAGWDTLNANDDKMTKVHHFYAQKMAYLIQLLKAIPEGDGSVFDNTAIFWLNECSVGNHGHRNIPIVIAGTMGGFFKNGDHIAEEINHQKMLIAMAQGMGHQIDTFGKDGMGVESRVLA